jgi:hypothetical protein
VEDLKASSSSRYAWPIFATASRVAVASRSSIFAIAKPTWTRTQSPMSSPVSASSRTLIVRLIPLTSTLAR